MSIIISIFVVDKTQRNFTNMTKANACKGKKKSSNRQRKVRKFAPVALILVKSRPSKESCTEGHHSSYWK